MCCVVLCRNQDAYVLAAFPAGAGGWECHVLALPVPPPRPGPNGQTEPQLPYHKVYQVLHTSAAETTHSKTHFPLPTKTPVPAEATAEPNPSTTQTARYYVTLAARKTKKNVHHLRAHAPAPPSRPASAAHLTGGEPGIMGAAADDAASVRAAVMRLSFGAAAEERRDAAGEVARLARADERTKRLLPELGVLPPLLDMLGGAGLGARLAAAGALLELARGTHRFVG